MSHNTFSVNLNYQTATSGITATDPETVLSEAAPNSTPTGSTFNYAVNDFYRWDGTLSNINSSYVTDHGDGTYTLQAGVYFITANINFQKSFSTNSKADWRFYNQTESEEIGAGVGAIVSPIYTNDVTSNTCAQIFEFKKAARIGLRLITIITGTFTNSNQDAASGSHLIITRL